MGAKRIAEACAQMRRLCEVQDLPAMTELAQGMQEAFATLKHQVGRLLQLRQQAKASLG